METVSSVPPPYGTRASVKKGVTGTMMSGRLLFQNVAVRWEREQKEGLFVKGPPPLLRRLSSSRNKREEKRDDVRVWWAG